MDSGPEEVQESDQFLVFRLQPEWFEKKDREPIAS
jgi:hypothetical protein